jgi:hypothetical protein
VSVAAIERHGLRHASTCLPPLALAGLTASLLLRLVPDVVGKPLHEDEAVAGLISARPLAEMLRTVILDRGGAPLHFLLAHLALTIDPSADGLRWLSVVFALATVPLCYDVARRLAGVLAGLTAAALAATSHLLLIYGTFGRMYSLFAFASVLAVDLFIRAIERPGRGTAVAAAAAALLPLAAHPFGAFSFAAEAVVAAVLWRGRAAREALPAIGVALLALPLLLTDLRLSERYAPETGQDLPGGYSPGSAALHGLGGAAGGDGLLLAVFAALAGAGLLAIGRRCFPAALFLALAITVPPALLAAGSAADLTTDRLSPRHFIFMLPLWTTLVGAGAAHVGSRLPPTTGSALPLVVVIVASLAPAAVNDPRSIATGERDALAAPARWIRANVTGADILYPPSPLFLASLPDAAAARTYPRDPVALARATKRIHEVRALLVSLPVPVPLSRSVLPELRGRGIDAHAFRSWLILRGSGTTRDGSAALLDAARMLGRARAPLHASPRTTAFLEQLRGTACSALRLLDSSC